MKSLTHKNVLLICPNFFGYELEIISELKRRGAVVDFLPDRPFQSPFLKALTRLRRELVLNAFEKFFWKALSKFNRIHYDFVLVVLGECVSPKLLKKLRFTFPETQFILYMWDSFKNKKFLSRNLPFFDRSFTFDLEDSIKYGILFRPLFYTSGFKKAEHQDFLFDISFIGTAHSDRYKIVSQIKKNLPKDVRSFFYLFLQAPWVYWIYKITNPAFKGSFFQDFSFIPLAKGRVEEVFAQSRTILDIEHPNQIGLTIRTIESLGAQKKLITTNSDVVNYDFFNPNNIFVIDRQNNIQVPSSFFSQPYEPLPDQLYEKYSIIGWLDDLIGVT